MKEYKKLEKQYIYFRDGCKCTFCGKELHMRQASLDHYLPKSKGGPDVLYNMVLSCKTCNKLKKSSIPCDYKELMIQLLKKSVQDRKVIGIDLDLKHDKLAELIEEVDRVEHIGEEMVFQSKRYRFYLKQHRIIRMVAVNGTYMVGAGD